MKECIMEGLHGDSITYYTRLTLQEQLYGFKVWRFPPDGFDVVGCFQLCRYDNTWECMRAIMGDS